jgi:hypothetical protein
MVGPNWAHVCGPLAPYAEGLRSQLERLGYTPLSAAGHVRLVAHLSRWMVRRGLAVSALTPTTVDAYFAERRATGYYNSLTWRSLRPLLDWLQQLGVVAAPGPVPATTPCERLLGRYRDYLLVERGLAASTVELNVRMVRPFLVDHVRADGQLDLQRLSAGEVAAFVVAQSRKRPRSVGRMVTGLRSLRSVSNARYMATQCAVSAMAARGAMDAEWATRREPAKDNRHHAENRGYPESWLHLDRRQPMHVAANHAHQGTWRPPCRTAPFIRIVGPTRGGGQQ